MAFASAIVWVTFVALFTGGISLLTALAGEQQRPGQQSSGMFGKLAQWPHRGA